MNGFHRRTVLKAFTWFGSGALWATKARAASLERTPEAWEGPWYPSERDIAAGADLTSVAGAVSKAVGDPILFGGRVMDATGKPLAGLRVDIWHVNAYGRYHHPDPQEGLPLDPGFRGYGETTTDAEGWYWFRTIAPVSYTRTVRVSGTFPPHIHIKVWRGRQLLLTTEAQFMPRPGRTVTKGPVNTPGPLAVRWASAQETHTLPPDGALPRADTIALFDIVL